MDEDMFFNRANSKKTKNDSAGNGPERISRPSHSFADEMPSRKFSMNENHKSNNLFDLDDIDSGPKEKKATRSLDFKRLEKLQNFRKAHELDSDSDVTPPPRKRTSRMFAEDETPAAHSSPSKKRLFAEDEAEDQLLEHRAKKHTKKEQLFSMRDELPDEKEADISKDSMRSMRMAQVSESRTDEGRPSDEIKARLKKKQSKSH